MGKLTKKESDIPWILLYKMQDDFETKGLLTAGMAGRIRTKELFDAYVEEAGWG